MICFIYILILMMNNDDMMKYLLMQQVSQDLLMPVERATRISTFLDTAATADSKPNHLWAQSRPMDPDGS